MVRTPKILLVVAVTVTGAVAVYAGTVWQRPKETVGPHVALAVENRLQAANQLAAAALVAEACKKDMCHCALVAGRSGLDVDAHLEVLEVLAAAGPSCPDDKDTSAMHAEAVARLGENDRAKSEATQILAKDPNNPFGLYAMALIVYRTAKPKDATVFAARAIDAGRGAPARILAGLIAFNQDDLDGASRHFRAVLETEPDDLEALFDLALVAQRSNRYTEAREGFLRVANLDPKHKNARYNLVILAHSIGANDEANHHLAKFEATFPGDARIVELKKLLATKPATSPAPTSPTNDAVFVAAPASSNKNVVR